MQRSVVTISIRLVCMFACSACACASRLFGICSAGLPIGIPFALALLETQPPPEPQALCFAGLIQRVHDTQ